MDADSLHFLQEFEDRTADGRVGRSNRKRLREVAVVLEDHVGGAARPLLFNSVSLGSERGALERVVTITSVPDFARLKAWSNRLAEGDPEWGPVSQRSARAVRVYPNGLP